MASQPLTGKFGESTEGFGARLDYSKPAYRDVIFAIAYYVHLLAVIGAGAYLWITQYPDVDSDDNDNSDSVLGDISPTGIFVAIAGTLVVAVIFGLVWLEIMKRFAGTIIKTMLLCNIGGWVAVAVLGVVVGELALVVLGAILALLYALYTWCIWSRIPFASALLSISSSITSSYGGTVLISLCVIFLDVIWVFLWGSMVAAYFLVDDNPSGFVTFLFLVSLYWGFQVNQNISHTTSCGVAATWYFTTELSFNPTPPALKRTLTTSFGSVCLGSLLVAALQALRAMVNAARNNRNAMVTCLVLCLLNCIESMIRWFNTYAFAHCAIYGTSFVQSARMTFDLFSKRGVLALINDNLTGLVIFAGALLGGIVSAAAGYLLGLAFYDDVTVQASLAGFGFLIGLIITMTVLYVVHSSVVAIFVCFAEDPAAMAQNRPEEFNRIVAARPAFGDFRNQYGQGNGV